MIEQTTLTCPTDIEDGGEEIDTKVKHVYVSANLAASPSSASSLDQAETDPQVQQENESHRWQVPFVARARKIYAERTGGRLENAEAGKRRSWYQTVLRLGPLSGIFAVLLALLCIVASLGVLAGSDHTLVSVWPTPPSTFLAIFTAIGNLSMRYAAFQGIVIAWWMKALNGSKVGRLHYDWRAVQASLEPSQRAVKREVGFLGLACIASTLVVVDGPLLQRASVVQEAPQANSVTLQRSMVPQLPMGYTGAWSANDPAAREVYLFNDTMPSVNGPVSTHIILSTPDSGGFDDVISMWQENKGYPDIIRGCSETCTAKLVAPALAVTKCSTGSRPVNYTTPYGLEDLPTFNRAPPFAALSFATAAQLVTTEVDEEIAVYAGYSTTEDCVGTYFENLCNLKAAIGEYDVTVQGDRTFLDSAQSPRILKIIENPIVKETYDHGDHRSMLAGLVSTIDLQLQSFVANMNINGSNNIYAQAPEQWVLTAKEPRRLCSSYGNPMNILLASMNKLMVFYALAATQGVRWGNWESPAQSDYGFKTHTTTAGRAHGSESVFNTQFGYFAGAAAFEILCICLVVPTYRNWWKIGREVSFSPLEVAKAFETPLLTDSNSNSTGKDMADAHADLSIQLSVRKKEGRTRLAFSSDPEAGQIPEHGSYFDD